MKDGPLVSKSFAFAIRVVDVHKGLSTQHHEYTLSRQLLRSGTAIGASIREAQQAESRSDFVHKMAIALKEANETDYWLALLRATNYLSPEDADSLSSENQQLLKLLVASIKTAKQNLNRE